MGLEKLLNSCQVLIRLILVSYYIKILNVMYFNKNVVFNVLVHYYSKENCIFKIMINDLL